MPTSGPRPERRPFEHAVHLFLPVAAVGQGMAFEQALHTFGYLDAGAYSADDRCFYPNAPGLGPISDRVSELRNASRLVIRGAEGEHDWTIFVVAGRTGRTVASASVGTRRPGALRVVLRRYQTSLRCRGMTRWRLRRSTHIGGIATDHDATARAARSTHRAPRILEWMEAPTQWRQWRAAKVTTSRLGATSIAVSRTVSLEDGSPANASARSGTQRPRPRLP